MLDSRFWWWESCSCRGQTRHQHKNSAWHVYNKQEWLNPEWWEFYFEWKSKYYFFSLFFFFFLTKMPEFPVCLEKSDVCQDKDSAMTSRVAQHLGAATLGCHRYVLNHQTQMPMSRSSKCKQIGTGDTVARTNAHLLCLIRLEGRLVIQDGKPRLQFVLMLGQQQLLIWFSSICEITLGRLVTEDDKP